jgi:hypothetical protein
MLHSLYMYKRSLETIATGSSDTPTMAIHRFAAVAIKVDESDALCCWLGACCSIDVAGSRPLIPSPARVAPIHCWPRYVLIDAISKVEWMERHVEVEVRPMLALLAEDGSSLGSTLAAAGGAAAGGAAAGDQAPAIAAAKAANSAKPEIDLALDLGEATQRSCRQRRRQQQG